MRRSWFPSIPALGLAILLSACSSDDGGGPAPTSAPTAVATSTSAPATATRTATSFQPTIPATSTPAGGLPTSTPSSTATVPGNDTPTPSGGGAVSGLVVVRNDLRAGAGDALAAPPSAWSESPDGVTFSRALSHATWRVFGPAERQGTTSADGSFTIGDLPPGAYRLSIQKTLSGDLVDAIVPFVAGSDGFAEIVVEIAQGLVRATNTYRDGATVFRAVTGPNGNRLLQRDGAIAELSGSGRTYVDADGDGAFDPIGCNDDARPWLCGEDGECGPDHRCACIPSCPFCDDCFIGACVPPGAGQLPYRCPEEGSCFAPGESCVCVGSCPDCEDCPASVCLGSCDPAQITSLTVAGPDRLYTGQQAGMRATATLSDGFAIDVTYLVAWSTSDASVATIDSWGTLHAVATGPVDVVAALGGVSSAPWRVEVAERPPLQRIHLQNIGCIVPFGQPDVGPGGVAPQPPADASILPPDCRQVVRVGGTLQLFALGEFDDGYFEDLTGQVTWEVAPAAIGEVSAGLFRGLAVGNATVRARLGGVTSNALEIRVVDRPTVVALHVYPLTAVPREGPLPPRADDALFPCYDCGFVITLLRGDQLPFQAIAQYDTGEWEDVTARAAWTSQDATIASVSDAGVATAEAEGQTSITATLDGVDGNAVGVRVVNEASLTSLSIYQDGLDRVVEKGGEAYFHAFGYYDVGFERDVTSQVTWHSSNEAIGGFSRPGVFVGRSAGTVEVWAQSDGVVSPRLPAEVFETSSLGYCDDNNINRAEWSDAFNRVVLESDCAVYDHPDVATLRFTVTERERPGGIFDPCLDLYVYQGDRLVRTIREEGCGVPFVAPGAPEFDDARLRYQTLSFWDLRDDRGSPVPPGAYTIRGRFYLYFDPIVDLPVVVNAPNGRIPCVENSCGNGCGFVRACGGEEPPLVCPEVCTQICECPAGWGITTAGDCEPCTAECCPRGAACLPGTPSCDPPPVCCAPGQVCIPELPPCGPHCCPLGALCGPLDLPPCECCPDGAQCSDAFVPCGPPPPCCPRDAICILPWPTCPPGDCCPPGQTCPVGIVPCEEIMCCRLDGTCDPAAPPCR